MEIKAKVILKSGKDEAIKRFHQWVFSGAIKKIEGYPADGDVVGVFSNKDEFLGIGHYQSQGSISVRIFDFNINQSINWKEKILNAYNLRKKLGLIDNKDTNAFRLVFAEGDFMPGVIIDVYDKVVVIQCHSIGFYKIREEIAEILTEIFSSSLETIYIKSKETLPEWYRSSVEDHFILGKTEECIIKENGIKFYVNIIQGQKTGFYIDQRENRKLLMNYCKDKKVLNTFCYSGGFSLYAIKAGSSEVISVDSSQKAIELLQKNLVLNNFNDIPSNTYTSDVMQYLQEIEENYFDIVILDPPAFAKHIDVRHNAIQGYKRLNLAALKKIKKGGLLFTFSCSQVIDRQLFISTVLSASILAKRNVRILHHLSQPPDHPVSIFHPESEYLKGLVLLVE